MFGYSSEVVICSAKPFPNYVRNVAVASQIPKKN